MSVSSRLVPPPGGRLGVAAVPRIAQLVLGVMFVVAAVGKISDLPYFAQQLHNFRLAPVWSEHLLAMITPWVELAAGAALLTGWKRRAGAHVALALMLIFTLAVASAWARGLDFHCGCFGKLGAEALGARKLAENLGLTLLAAYACLPPRGGRIAPEPLPQRTTSVPRSAS